MKADHRCSTGILAVIESVLLQTDGEETDRVQGSVN